MTSARIVRRGRTDVGFVSSGLLGLGFNSLVRFAPVIFSCCNTMNAGKSTCDLKGNIPLLTMLSMHHRQPTMFDFHVQKATLRRTKANDSAVRARSLSDD
jgi:hypothetical protein